MAEKFNLVNHTHNILKIAEANEGMTLETALQSFIVNLSIMREHYKGCSELNFHDLGQQWNKLLSKEKVEQKDETLARLKKYPRSGGRAYWIVHPGRTLL